MQPIHHRPDDGPARRRSASTLLALMAAVLFATVLGLAPAGAAGTAPDGELTQADLVQRLSRPDGLDADDVRVPGGSAHASAASADSTRAAAAASGGYWLLEADGTVYPFGTARSFGDWRGQYPRRDTHNTILAFDLEPTPSGEGYWLLDVRGRVEAFGDASDLGGPVGQLDLSGARLELAMAIKASPSGHGYWVFTNRGRVFAYGDATHHGDLTQVRDGNGRPLSEVLNGPVIDASALPSGTGYYMVASDGGVFSFGAAKFHGSMGGKTLNASVQGLAPDPDDVGYWLVAGDGGIFAFDAAFRGSVPGVLQPGQSLNRPVNGMVAYGNGYIMVASDGGIFVFSDAPFAGSLGANPPDYAILRVRPVPAGAASPSPTPTPTPTPTPSPTADTSIAVRNQTLQWGGHDLKVVRAVASNTTIYTWGTASPLKGDERHLYVRLRLTSRRTVYVMNFVSQIFRVRYPDGTTVAPERLASVAPERSATDDLDLVFPLPEGQDPAKATLVVGTPGVVEQGELPLTAPVRKERFPLEVGVEGSRHEVTGLTCGFPVGVQLEGAHYALDLPDAFNQGLTPGERQQRAAAGHRILVLDARVFGTNNTCGGHNVQSDMWRLVVDGVPASPVSRLNAVVKAGAAIDVTVFFVVPADAKDLELLVGRVGGTRHEYAVPLPAGGLGR